jgi:hypothetical protein
MNAVACPSSINMAAAATTRMDARPNMTDTMRRDRKMEEKDKCDGVTGGAPKVEPARPCDIRHAPSQAIALSSLLS